MHIICDVYRGIMQSKTWTSLITEKGTLQETDFFEQIWRCRVQNIHYSCFGWRGIELRIPTTSVVLPRRLVPCAPSSSTEAHSGPDGLSGKSAWGFTPLHSAAWYGRVAAAEFLLSKGAAVDAKTNSGRGLNPGSMCRKSSLSNLGRF